jgi:hypothetical protein
MIDLSRGCCTVSTVHMAEFRPVISKSYSVIIAEIQPRDLASIPPRAFGFFLLVVVKCHRIVTVLQVSSQDVS